MLARQCTVAAWVAAFSRAGWQRRLLVRFRAGKTREISMTESAVAPVRTVWLTGGLLGFALGGFFDGILLHQILQWHHLLSAIDPDDARMQVTADGLFHALMYVLALAGLGQLWRIARHARVPTAPLVLPAGCFTWLRSDRSGA